DGGLRPAAEPEVGAVEEEGQGVRPRSGPFQPGLSVGPLLEWEGGPDRGVRAAGVGVSAGEPPPQARREGVNEAGTGVDADDPQEPSVWKRALARCWGWRGGRRSRRDGRCAGAGGRGEYRAQG